MATYNTLIKKRNASNTGWDSILPITTAENVLINEQGDTVATHMADGVHQKVSVTDTTDATSTVAAPLKSAGGLAVAKKSFLGDTLNIKDVVMEVTSGLTSLVPNDTWVNLFDVKIGLTLVELTVSSLEFNDKIYSSVALILSPGQITQASIILCLGDLSSNPHSEIQLSENGKVQGKQRSGTEQYIRWRALNIF